MKKTKRYEKVHNKIVAILEEYLPEITTTKSVIQLEDLNKISNRLLVLFLTDNILNKGKKLFTKVKGE